MIHWQVSLLFPYGKLAPAEVVDTIGFEYVRLVSDTADKATEQQHLDWIRSMNFSAIYHAEVSCRF
jgi:hypothetical protein